MLILVALLKTRLNATAGNSSYTVIKDTRERLEDPLALQE